MADVKFSQFPAGSAISGIDTTVGLQSGVNVEWTWTQANTFMAANIATAPYVIGDLLFADSTSTLSRIADIATGNVLLSGGVGVVPVYGKVDLTTHVTGTLPVLNGGTGQTTYTDGQLLIGNTTGNTLVKANITAGSGITVTNGNGTITLDAVPAGVLPVVNGGTGQSSYTDGQLLIGNSTGNTLTKTTLTAGSGITITNGNGSITIDATADANVTQQDTYDNSSTGNVALASGKHQGYSSTAAVFYTPSMSNAQFAAVPSLPNGGIGWSIEDDRFNVNAGTPGTPEVEKLAYLSDITAVTNNEVFGEMFFTGNTTATVIASTATPVKVNATYNSGSLQEFTQSTGTLTYTATLTRTMDIKISLTASPATTTSNISFFIMKNGTAITNTTQSIDFDPTIPSQKSVTLSGSVSLATGNTIQIFVKNNTVVDNIIVGNLNCFITSIGGVNEGTGATLESAYTEGDGTMTMTTGKPLVLDSTDNAIIPTFELNQIAVPSTLQVISRTPTIANGVQYAMEEVTVGTTVGTTSVINRWGLGGSPTIISTYTGSIGTEHYNSKLTQGGNNQGVVTTVSNVTLPRTNYGLSNGQYLMWVSGGIVGAPQITANSFALGDSIEIDVMGSINISNTGTAVILPSTFQVVVGSIIDVHSNNVNTSSLPSSFTGCFQWRFRIVRTDGTSQSNGLNVSSSGFFEDSNGSMKLINFSNSFWTTQYNGATTYPISVFFNKGVSHSSGTFAYEAWGLTIKQYS